ncbi:hypothetical protein MWU54_14160 [Marivita sp. S6314]|uniref:hypothetical protein n=1 Tax=Marivita sp. S6314 TaxID=2926406 RepID=UPI001FF63382|nr:hypothetical protein [Marivita sp. S6314]MCK0151180.1 hypothetical protein [Marivita sp. S6314]
MRHERDLHRAGPPVKGVARLFELHRQDALQTGGGRCYGQPDTLRADVALGLRAKAVQSLRPRQSDKPR